MGSFSQRYHNSFCLTWGALVIIYIIYIFKNVESVCDRSCFIISWDLWPEKYFDISTFLKTGKGEKWPGTVFHQRSDLFNKSLFFSEWNIYKYFPFSLRSAMFFITRYLHYANHDWCSWLTRSKHDENNFGFLFRIHFVSLLFLIPSNFWMCVECIQFQSFPAEEWTPSNSKVNILSKTFHSKKKIVEKCQKKTLWLPPNWRRIDDFSSCVGLWLKFGQWCLTLVDLVVK